SYTVHALSSDKLTFGKNKLMLNLRQNVFNKNGLVYVLDEDLKAIQTGTKRVEPLILRANAGDCIQVTLINEFTFSQPVFQTTGAVASLDILGLTTANTFGYNIKTAASNQVGLTPQLLASDVTKNLGFNVG